MSLTKPNGKSIATVAVSAGSFVIGAKLGDGLAAVMPDSMNSYKKFAIAGVSILAAACIAPKSTMEQAAQHALVGLGAKQLFDELSNALEGAIPAKLAQTDASGVAAPKSMTTKFVDGLVGRLGSPLAQPSYVANSSTWLGVPGDIWDRPEELEYETQPVLTLTGI